MYTGHANSATPIPLFFSYHDLFYTTKYLQVWFQNARAKYRRNLLKQQQNGGASASDVAASGGDPMNAGSATAVAAGAAVSSTGTTGNDDSCSSDSPTGQQLTSGPLSPGGLSDISSTSVSISALMAPPPPPSLQTTPGMDMMGHGHIVTHGHVLSASLEHQTHHHQHQHQHHHHHHAPHLNIQTDNSGVLGMYSSLHADL